MSETFFYIQTGLFIFVQIAAVAYIVGSLKATINGTVKRVDKNEKTITRAHKRMDDHVLAFHTRGKK